MTLFQAKDDASTKGAFRLKTLEEHRFATRFEDSKVTPATWRRAHRDAVRKLRGGDRIQLVEALYLLLEIADLRPRACDVARVHLNAGAVYLAFSHLDEAVKAFQQSLHADPTSWKARFNLGVALARQRVFTLASTELTNALGSCPQDVAVQIHELLAAIKTIQARRNEQAYNATDEARQFTWRYLETLHLMATHPWRIDGSQIHSGDSRDSSPPSAPLLFDVARGWNGPIAELLHTLHVHANINHVSIDAELDRMDAPSSGCVSVSSFMAFHERVTGVKMASNAARALREIFPNDAVMYRLLVPNAETLEVIDEMQRRGVFFAGLSWRLTKRRQHRSPQSRSGGFWRWMELPVESWIAETTEIAPTSSKGVDTPARILLELGFLTPMHFVTRDLRGMKDVVTLPRSDRDALAVSINTTASTIRGDACRVLQLLFRRLHWRTRKAVLQASHRPRGIMIGQNGMMDESGHHISVREQQHISRLVIETLDEMVESVVSSIRNERYAQITPVSTDESPMRTENRHRLDVNDECY